VEDGSGGGGPPLGYWTGTSMTSSTGVLDGELDGDLHGEELNGVVDGELAGDLHGEELPSWEPLLYHEKKAVQSTMLWG
jgi:hypothetical protein